MTDRSMNTTSNYEPQFSLRPVSSRKQSPIYFPKISNKSASSHRSHPHFNSLASNSFDKSKFFKKSDEKINKSPPIPSTSHRYLLLFPKLSKL